MPVEQMPLGEQKMSQKVENENRIVSATEINPEIVKTIKEGDALGVKEATEELKNFAAQEKGEAKKENEGLISLAEQKLDEMQAEIDKKKKGMFNKMLYTEKDLAASESAIATARNIIAKGELPDMHTIKRLVKFAQKVDISGLPEREGKQFSAAGHGIGESQTRRL